MSSTDHRNNSRAITCSGFQWILVGTGGNLYFASFTVVAQPAPAGTLNGHCGGGQFLLEILEAAERRVQCIRQLFGAIGFGWRQILPENGMIEMTTAIETNTILQCNHFRCVILAERLLQLGFGRIEIGHIGLMMFQVMQFHDFTANDRFEGAVIIAELGQGVLTTYGCDNRCRCVDPECNAITNYSH